MTRPVDIPAGARAMLVPALALALLGAEPAAAQSKGSGPGAKPKPVPTEALAFHVLDRVTYGHTEADLALVRAIGVDEYLRQQLAPGG